MLNRSSIIWITNKSKQHAEPAFHLFLANSGNDILEPSILCCIFSACVSQSKLGSKLGAQRHRQALPPPQDSSTLDQIKETVKTCQHHLEVQYNILVESILNNFMCGFALCRDSAYECFYLCTQYRIHNIDHISQNK